MNSKVTENKYQQENGQSHGTFILRNKAVKMNENNVLLKKMTEKKQVAKAFIQIKSMQNNTICCLYVYTVREQKPCMYHILYQI